MDATGRAFRDWVAAQESKDYAIEVKDDDHIVLKADEATGEVNFYSFEDMPEIVELRVTENATDENLFFLHFELEDLDHAKELFDEMADVLGERAHGRRTTRVLLCCTVGMTTSMFAGKLDEVAKTLSLDYRFEAKALEDAKREGGAFSAVMLAPQVGFRRREVAEAFPGAIVFEIPAKIFGSFDAASALRMLMDLLGDNTLDAIDPRDLRVLREMKNDKTIMLVSIIRKPRLSTIAYRVYDHFKLVAADEVYKCRIELRDIEDVLATLHLKGVMLDDLDAVGVAVPGSVDFGRVRFISLGFGEHDIENRLMERFGVRVFVDNNANAAAVGCYVSQDAYDSVLLHTQQVGYLVGGEGLVVNGHLVRGHGGAAGELGFLTKRLFLDGGMHLQDFEDGHRGYPEVEDKSDVPWRADRMLPILATTLTCGITVAAPDAVYISYDLIDDMDALRKELAKAIPDEFMPDLIHITDYHEKIFEGELALVLQRLNTSAT